MGKQCDNRGAAVGQETPYLQLMGFNISPFKNEMRPESAKWDQISCPGPIFEKNEVSGVKAFALTGRITDCHYTQGAALG